MGGLLSPGTDNESLKKIATETTKPWYKKVEIWLSVIAIFLATIALFK